MLPNNSKSDNSASNPVTQPSDTSSFPINTDSHSNPMYSSPTSNVLVPDITVSNPGNVISDMQTNSTDVTMSATPTNLGDDPNLTNTIIGSSQVPTKYGGKKIIATIFGIVLLITGIAAGVYLVNNQQELRERAASGSECSHSTDCILLDSPGNQGSFTAPRLIDHLFITARDYHRYDPPGTNDGCYNVNISGNSLTWNRVGDGPDCKDISNIQIWLGGAGIESPTPTPSPSPSPSPIVTTSLTPSLSPTPIVSNSPTPTPVITTPVITGITASCSEVKVYDTNWQLLDSSDLGLLKSGDIVRITVSGTASAGNFTKARFIINGVTTAETTAKKPGTQEFYHQYTIPSKVSNFSFNGEVFHSELGWI